VLFCGERNTEEERKKKKLLEERLFTLVREETIRQHRNMSLISCFLLIERRKTKVRELTWFDLTTYVCNGKPK
jgi:hypothetical protein